MRVNKSTRGVYQKGDTLIEVLFAFAVLSLVIVGALSIMNQGTIASQRSLERTIVRQEVDAQTATLQFLHDAYVANYKPGATSVTLKTTTPAGQWAKMSESIPTTMTPTSLTGLTACPAAYPTGSFVFDTTTATFKNTPSLLVHSVTTAQVAYTSAGAFSQAQGIWIEAVRANNPGSSGDVNKQNTRYIDFHVNACWDAPGGGAPMTVSTIVRLYEPRG